MITLVENKSIKFFNGEKGEDASVTYYSSGDKPLTLSDVEELMVLTGQNTDCIFAVLTTREITKRKNNDFRSYLCVVKNFTANNIVGKYVLDRLDVVDGKPKYFLHLK
jgi:hypothetical protein